MVTGSPRLRQEITRLHVQYWGRPSRTLHYSALFIPKRPSLTFGRSCSTWIRSWILISPRLLSAPNSSSAFGRNTPQLHVHGLIGQSACTKGVYFWNENYPNGRADVSTRNMVDMDQAGMKTEAINPKYAKGVSWERSH